MVVILGYPGSIPGGSITSLMSLDKAIEHGKEHRKPYYGKRGPAIDPSCRKHGIGGCPACRGSRTIQTKRVNVKANDELDHDQGA